MAEENGLNSVNRSKNSSGNPSANGSSTLAKHRRASIGPIHAGNGLLRNSAEKTDSADISKKNVVPHYLRASTGSCHDFCKYGREHSFEKKERKPRKRIPKQQPFVEILLSDKQKKEKKLSTDTKDHSPDLKPSPDPKSFSPKPKPSLDKGKGAMKQKPSKETKNHSPDMPCTKSHVKTFSRKENGSSDNKTLLSKKPSKIVSPSEPPEVVKGVIFPSTEVVDSVKRATSTDKSLSRMTTHVSQPVKLKSVKVKTSANSDNSDGVRGKGTGKGSSKTGKNLTTPVKKVLGKNLTASKTPVKNNLTVSKTPVKKVLAAPVATLSPKLSMNKIARNNSGKAGNLKLVSSVKDQNKLQRVKTEVSNDEKVSEKIKTEVYKDEKVSEKSSRVSTEESNAEKVFEKTSNVMTEESNDEKVSEKSSRVSTEESNDEKVFEKTSSVMTEESNDEKVSEETSSVETEESNDEKVSVKTSSVETEESNDEKVSEKTLHVIEMDIKNVSESTPVSESISTESLCSADYSSLSSHEDDDIQTEESSGEADEVKAQPVRENPSKTVRKSRVVSEDKCVNPVKLKFRSGKVVDVQMDSNSPRRLRFRRGRILGGQDSKGETRRTLRKAGPKDGTIGAQVSPVKVVLKHQDVQDKKDAQVLLNNVIEETASKLVETRKSKVKALVGAFETVISLQETKPSPQVS